MSRTLNDGRARVALLAAALVASILIAAVPADAGTQTAAAAPPRIGQIVPRSSDTLRDGLQSKSRSVECPPGYRILGGGAEVYPAVPLTRSVRLTHLEPLEHVNGGPNQGYTATAASPTVTQITWGLRVYALCTDRADGHHIVPARSNFSTNPMQRVVAECEAGERVMGTGAATDNSRVGLQVARSDRLGGIVRAQGHAAPGVQPNWRVTAYAVCATTPQGYHVEFDRSPEELDEEEKTATVSCNGDRRMSAGGAISNVLTGEFWLQSVQPITGGARAYAIENPDTGDAWDFIVAATTCVDP